MNAPETKPVKLPLCVVVIFGGTINLVVTALTAEKSGAIFDPAIPAVLLIFAFVIT